MSFQLMLSAALALGGMIGCFGSSSVETGKDAGASGDGDTDIDTDTDTDGDGDTDIDGDADGDVDGDGDADSEIIEAIGLAVLEDGSTLVCGKLGRDATFGEGDAGIELSANGQRGNVFFAGYDPQGELRFATQTRGDSYAEGHHVAALENGYILIGYYEQEITFEREEGDLTLTGERQFIAKYDLAGDLLWAENLTSAQTGVDSMDIRELQAIAGGELLLLGTSDAEDIHLARLDGEGGLLWSKMVRHDDYFCSWEWNSMSLAIDGEENITVAGCFSRETTFGEAGEAITLTPESNNQQIFMARYAPDGQLESVVSSHTPEYVIYAEDPDEDEEMSSGARAAGIATLPGGGFVMSGGFEYHLIFGVGGDEVVLGTGDAVYPRGFLARFDDDGEVGSAVQSRVDMQDGSSTVFGTSACADGSAVVGGVFHGAVSFLKDDSATIESLGHEGGSTNQDIFVARYDDANELAWVKPLTSKGHSWIMASGATGACDVFVTGGIGKGANFGTDDDPVEVTVQEGLKYDFFLARYDATGELVWVAETY